MIDMSKNCLACKARQSSAEDPNARCERHATSVSTRNDDARRFREKPGPIGPMPRMLAGYNPRSVVPSFDDDGRRQQ